MLMFLNSHMSLITLIYLQKIIPMILYMAKNKGKAKRIVKREKKEKYEQFHVHSFPFFGTIIFFFIFSYSIIFWTFN